MTVAGVHRELVKLCQLTDSGRSELAAVRLHALTEVLAAQTRKAERPTPEQLDLLTWAPTLWREDGAFFCRALNCWLTPKGCADRREKAAGLGERRCEICSARLPKQSRGRLCKDCRPPAPGGSKKLGSSSAYTGLGSDYPTCAPGHCDQGRLITAIRGPVGIHSK